jgi:hypothetical protein
MKNNNKNFHNLLKSIFHSIKALPNFTKYQNTILINPTHIQIITKNRLYYVKNSKINLTRINFPIFNDFVKIDKTQSKEEVK